MSSVTQGRGRRDHQPAGVRRRGRVPARSARCTTSPATTASAPLPARASRSATRTTRTSPRQRYWDLYDDDDDRPARRPRAGRRGARPAHRGGCWEASRDGRRCEITADDVRRRAARLLRGPLLRRRARGRGRRGVRGLRPRRGHGGRADVRPRRLPRRARPLVQDVVPRACRPRAADRARAGALLCPARRASRCRSSTCCRRSRISRGQASRARSRTPVDGRTLVPLLEGAVEDAEATAVGEYLAECVPAPMVMIRRGRWKFVHMPGDPDQLFDLDADPLELSNLAADEAQEDVVSAFREEARRRWDLERARARRPGEPACAVDRLRRPESRQAVRMGLPTVANRIRAVHAEHHGRRRA